MSARRRSCGKARYRNRHTAQRELERLRLSWRDDEPPPCRPYACAFCKGWHLTSSPS